MTIDQIKAWRADHTIITWQISVRGLEIIDTLLAEVERFKDYHGCAFAGPGRGDCESHTNYKGISIPDQHDGSDDTEDVYGRPNGVCWWCWHTEQIRRLHSKLRTTEQKLAVATDALRKITDIENRYDCGDWEEIEEARSVATAALKQIQEAGNE